MTMAIPMVHFVRNTVSGRLRLVPDVLIALLCANALAQGAAYRLFGVPFIDMLPLTHLLLTAGVAAMLTVLFRSYREQPAPQLRLRMAAFAALGVFGYVTMKRAQAAAEAERKRAEEEARRKAAEETRRKEYAETHEFLTCPVSGVTFDSRQRVLTSLYRDSEGVGIDGSLEACEYEGAPAVSVFAEGDMIGYIRKSDLRKVLPILERVEDVTITIDNFDDGGSKVYNAEARIVYHI